MSPAAAVTRDPAHSAAAYVRARAAEMAGQLDVAAAGYAAALADSPNDATLAARTYRQALAAGDHALASRAAALLDSQGKLPPDGTLLLAADAVTAKDWPRARLLVERIEHEELFSFMAPVLRAWVTLGARDGDPIAQLAAGTPRAIALPYLREHRALLLLATGRLDDGIAAARALGSATGGRALRLDLAAATSLTAARRRDDALAMLAGDDLARSAARALVAAGKPFPGGVATPAQGYAELFTRVAADINRERVTPLALGLARIATFIAPGNADTWLIAANMLAAAGQYSAALAALDRIPLGDPLAADASDLRLRFLKSDNRNADALTVAIAGPQRPGANDADWTRLGDLYLDLDRPREAAAAYQRALTIAAADPVAAQTIWTLWLRRGGALEQAGDWPAAKAALTRAVELAPDQPTALNYLGYAQLERRENLAEAEKLIERASALRPDDSAITDSLGWAYYVRGDLPKAIATLERAVAAEPGEPTMNEHLGDAYWAAGRRYEARGAWRAALVYADPAEVVRIKGKIQTGAPRLP